MDISVVVSIVDVSIMEVFTVSGPAGVTTMTSVSDVAVVTTVVTDWSDTGRADDNSFCSANITKDS